MVSEFEELSVTESGWILIRAGSQQELQIHLKNCNILGRGQNKGVRYSIGVSRKHALLKKTVNDGLWEIMDLGSTNGLFINGTKVPSHCLQPVKEFDIIGLGVANALREEHFSFMLCRISKQEDQHEIVTTQNVKGFSEKAVTSSEGDVVVSTESNLCEMEENKINVNVISQNLVVENEYVRLRDGTSDSSNTNNVELSNRDSDKLIRNDQQLKSSTTKENLINCQRETGEGSSNLKVHDKQNNPVHAPNGSSKAEEIEDEDICILFEKKKHKRKRKEIPIIEISDDTDSDDDVTSMPRKTAKLRKKNPTFSCSQGNDSTSNEIILKNTLPTKTDNNREFDLINSFCGTEEKNKNRYNSREGNLAENEHFQHARKSSHCCAQPRQQSKNNPTDTAVSVLGRAKIKHEPISSRDCTMKDPGFQLSDEISNGGSNNCATWRLDSDIDVTKQDEEKFLYDDHIYDGNVLNNDEVPISDTVDDGFNFEYEMDFGVPEEELLDRIVWPPKPDDSHEEDTPLQHSEKYFHIDTENAEGRKSQHIKSQPEKNSAAQFKHIGNKCINNSIKLIEALPLKNDKFTEHLSLKERAKKSEGCWKHIRNKQRKITSVNDVKHYRNRSWSKSIMETMKKLPVLKNSYHIPEKPKIITNTPSVPRFQSRNELLLISMLNGGSVNKKQIPNKMQSLTKENIYVKH